MDNLRPKYISFHITNRCNTKCRICRIWSLEEPPHPDPQDFLRTVDQIADWVGESEIIVAGGEPLLEETTYAILERAHQRGMKTVLSTNGFLIDDTMARRLAQAGLTIANISLDGFENTHNRLRNRPGAYGLVTRAIDALQAVGVVVRINCVILNDNLDQIPELVDFLSHDGRVNGMFFQAMAKPFGVAGTDSEWWKTNVHFPQDIAAVHALLDWLLAKKQQIGFILNEDNQFPALKAYFANPDRFSLAKCTVGEMGFTINARGDILLCNMMDPIGSITEGRDIRQIYHSSVAQALRENMHACDINCHLLINCSFDPTQLVFSH